MGKKNGDKEASSKEAGKQKTKQNRGADNQGMSLQNVLDDLNMRFILNCPHEELASLERVFFQVEAAHWFYDDFYRETYKHLPHLGLKEFSQLFVRRCPALKGALGLADDDAVASALHSFTKYKRKVPVCGCILLDKDMSECILVKGWIPGSNWGFPKGKINADEPEFVCAVREVLEETGFDASAHVSEKDFIERNDRGQKIRLYVARDVPRDYHFVTQTRKEISQIKWFNIDAMQKGSLSAGDELSEFGARRFIGDLVQWREENAPEKAAKSSKKSRKKKDKDKEKPRSAESSPRSHEVSKEEKKGKGKPKRRGSDAANTTTFGHQDDGWSIDEMFAVNEAKFGVVNTFNYEEYTTQLPDAETQAKALAHFRANLASQGKGKSRCRSTNPSPSLQPQPKLRKEQRRHSVGSGMEKRQAPAASSSTQQLAPSVASMFAAFSDNTHVAKGRERSGTTGAIVKTSEIIPEASMAAAKRTDVQPLCDNIPNLNLPASEAGTQAGNATSCGAHVAPMSSFTFNCEEIMSCI
jgi:8-oxo-dGTP pyrophosphatase MutT (NUDIX family)